MNPVSTREEELFADALARPVDERAAFLDGACRSDAELRAKLEALLAAHASSDSLLGAPHLRQGFGGQAVAPRELPVEEKPGDMIGPPAVLPAEALAKVGGSAQAGRYKLLQKIGEGGCGVVWMAEQEEPVRRRVALKVIKLGMDTKAVVARFEAERQALAMMDHPHIAKVFDAGVVGGMGLPTHESDPRVGRPVPHLAGRPYFVMELIRGIPITKYCDENHLTPAARLELFVKVCQAIQHAHQKGVIHRDIKPSNILVTVNDGQPTPKVIDFGIAKATQGKLTDATVFTAFEQFIGTPVYMSPEQAEMSSLDIDTRSDIYSLGVLLYELLAGRPPFDPRKFAQAGVDEIRKQIREVDPARPSARLRTLTEEEQTTIARLRSTAPSELSVVLRGDLDWIIMRCLEKDRTRRYDTANGLALDIQRYLRHEPIAAHPPSTVYLLQKVIRRHRFGFAAAAGIVVALFAGLAVALWSLANERAARERAVAAEHEQTRLRADADQARTAAEAARDREAKLRGVAEAQELLATRHAYASDMSALQRALDLNNLGRARELLYRHVPEPDKPDLRGWEWRYLWQFCQSEAQSIVCENRNRIGSVAVSPDGQWLGVADVELGGLSVFNLRSKREVRVPAGDDYVWAAFSPREPLLAVAISSDTAPNRILLWDAGTERVLREIPVPGRCGRLAYCDEGRQLIAQYREPDGTVCLARWRVSDGEQTARFVLPVGAVLSGEYAPLASASDFSTAAYAANGGIVCVFDLATGVQRWQRRTTSQSITALAFSPDGRVLATGGGGQAGVIQLWDVADGRQLSSLDGHQWAVRGLAFMQDGKRLASASYDHTIRIWNLESGRLAQTLRGHRHEVWALAAHPDDRRLFSGCKDGSVYVWDTLSSGRAPGAFSSRKPVVTWQFAAESSAVVTVDAAGVVERWMGATLQNRVELLATEPCRDAVLDVERSHAAIVSRSGRIALWDWARRTKRAEWPAGIGAVQLLGFTVSGDGLLVARGTGPSWSAVEEWDTKTGQMRRQWPVSLTSMERTFASADRRHVAFVGTKGHGLLDLNSGGLVLSSPLRSGAPAFSPDGHLIAIPLERGDTRIWSASAVRDVAMLKGFLLAPKQAAFSPDNKRLVVTSAGTEVVKMWDTATWESLITLSGSPSYRSRQGKAAFSPDGNIFCSQTDDRNLHFWRAPSWDEIAAAEKAQTASGQER